MGTFLKIVPRGRPRNLPRLSTPAASVQQFAPASTQPLTPEMVQQMIIFAFSALGILGKIISMSPFWYFDSSASNHMTNNPQLFTNSTKYPRNLTIHTANGNHLPITNIGDISSSLTDVFAAPGLITNLISIGQLVDNNCCVEFSHSGCLVQDQRSRKMIAKGPKVGCLFPLHLPLSSSCSLPFISSNSAHLDYHLWHKRLGHPNSHVLHAML